MTEQFANNASSTLSGTITSGATSLNVSSAATFPTTGNFRILIDSEIMIVTNVSSNTFTVTRAQENTSAAAHTSGVAVVHIFTAGAIAQLKVDTASDWQNSTMGTFDWTAQTTQSLTTDTTYLIGGQTWTKVNSANEATHLQLTNGTGLVFKPSSSTQFGGSGTRTAPMLMLQLSAVIPNFGPDTPFQIWAYWSAQNPTANFDETFIGLDSGASTPIVWRAGIAFNSSLGQQLANAVNAGAYSFDQGTNATTDVVECLTLPSGLSLPIGSLSSSSTAYSGGVWPDVTVRNFFNGNGVAATSTWGNSSTYYATFGSQRQGSATSLSSTLAAVRIRYR